MRLDLISQPVVERLSAALEARGIPGVEYVGHPGDKTVYALAPSVQSVYNSAPEAAAYLLGALLAVTPAQAQNALPGWVHETHDALGGGALRRPREWSERKTPRGATETQRRLRGAFLDGQEYGRTRQEKSNG